MKTVSIALCVALISCTPAQTANDIATACQAYEQGAPVVAVIAELVDLTGLPASEFVTEIDAFCKANGPIEAQKMLDRELTMTRAARAKALAH